jgi:hypothetical protein
MQAVSVKRQAETEVCNVARCCSSRTQKSLMNVSPLFLNLLHSQFRHYCEIFRKIQFARLLLLLLLSLLCYVNATQRHRFCSSL